MGQFPEIPDFPPDFRCFSCFTRPKELDARHRTALHRAAQQGHVETVELLMQVEMVTVVKAELQPTEMGTYPAKWLDLSSKKGDFSI
jgi:hypothetical protein